MPRICNNCGKEWENDPEWCRNCGSADLSEKTDSERDGDE